MRHDPNHTEILCFRNGKFFWECEECPFSEPAKQGKFKDAEDTRQFQLRLVAA
jgi:hypothetical protein